MAKKVLSSEIIEQNIFENTIKSALKLEEQLKSLNAEYVNTAKATQEILKASKFSDTKSINEFLKASNEANKILKEQLKVEQELAKVVKIRTETEAKASLINAKQKTEEARATAIATREQERKAKASEREARANSALSSTYARVNSWLGKLRNEYRDLAIKKELGVTLTSKEEFRYGVLEKRIQAYDTALKKVDASMGNYQRNVGNYASGFNGLGNSINQITREAPAFANSVNTGLMAISNNIPMLFDELSKIKKANVELKAQGLETKSMLSQLGTAIFSWGTALSVGVTLLTLYGAKMIDWVSNALKPANDELRQMEERQKRIDADRQKQAQYVGKESSMYVGLVLALKQTNKGSKERIELMNTINKDYGTTLKNLKDEKDFQDQLNKSIEQYLLFKEAEYKQKKNTELIEVGLAKREKLEYQLNKLEKERKQTMDDRMAAEIRFNLRKQQLDQQGIKDYNIKLLQEQSGLLRFIELDNQINNTQEQINGINGRLEKYGLNIMNANKVTSQWNKTTDNQTKSQKELNLYTSKYLEILAKLIELQEKDKVLKNERDLDKEVQKQLDNIRTTGDGELKEIERLLNESEELRQNAREKEFKANEDARMQEYENKKKDLEKEMNSLDKKDKKYLDKKKQYEEALKNLEIDYKKQSEVNTLANEQEKTKITNEEITKRTGVMKQLSDEWFKYYDEQNEKEIKSEEEKLKRKKDIFKSLDQLAKWSTDYYLRQSNRKIEAIDREMNMLQRQQEHMQRLAENGNITAEQSLAKNEEMQIEANKRRQQELKKQERIKLAMTVLDAYNSNLQSKELGGKNALVKTITDVSLLTAFINSLPAFFDGTEDTGINGKGIDGKGGFLSILHPKERVITKEQNEKMQGISNVELSTLAENYMRGNLIHKHEGASSNLSAWQLVGISDKLDELTNVIKNKPETNIAMGEIVGGVMKIVETTKVSNTTTRNIHRFNKKI